MKIEREGESEREKGRKRQREIRVVEKRATKKYRLATYILLYHCYSLKKR